MVVEPVHRVYDDSTSQNIGASKIIAVEPNEYRRERAKQFGDIIIDQSMMTQIDSSRLNI